MAALLSIIVLPILAQNKGNAYIQSTEKVRLQDDFKGIELSELPQSIKASALKYYPTASIRKVFVSEAGQYKLQMSLKDGTKGT